MGKPSRVTQKKRSRELAQIERQNEKKEQKALKKAERAELGPGADNGEDPDLAGIVPGPQPQQEN